MPTFLTEYTCHEHGETALGPYIAAKDLDEAVEIASHLSIHADGVQIVVVGEECEPVPANVNLPALRMLQHRVAFEVEQIISRPKQSRLAFLLDEPKDDDV
jgi:hypothetical protein